MVASYVYDAWGNHKVCNPNGTENTSSTFIGNINPFRYRGYYYDAETGLYYLQSRYYDPTMYRFINADDVDVLHGYSTTLNGLNLFSYCINNPVMHTDPTGHAIGLIIGIIVGAVGLVFGADAIIQTVGDYKRNPTAANIFAIILAVAFVVLDLFFFVSEVIAAVRALKTVDAVVDTAKVADGASDVIETTASLSKVDSVLGEGQRVFWSGGDEAQDAARMFAKKNCGTILEDTPLGKMTIDRTRGMKWTSQSSIWEDASRRFAQSAVGKQDVAHVFINSIKFRLDGMWMTYEKDILTKCGIKIIEHIF